MRDDGSADADDAAARGANACPICEDGPLDVVARLGSSWVTMGERSPMAGYACLVFDRHAVELHDLSIDEGAAFMRDMQRLARAVQLATGASKLNYEIHGNTLPHLHVHFFPRHAGDAFEGRPIDPRSVRSPVYAPGELDALRARVVQELTRRDVPGGAVAHRPHTMAHGGPDAHATRSPAALPFLIQRQDTVVRDGEVSETVEDAHGLLRLERARVVVQWSTAREVTRVGREIRTDRELGPVREAVLPLVHLAGVELKRRWWRWPASWRLVLRAADLRAFEALAGDAGLVLEHPAELTLDLRRSDLPAAYEFVQDLELALADDMLASAEARGVGANPSRALRRTGR
jgi:diadenosine tetraphosphate (Ap4A) HIT family hydrolase